MRQHPRYELIEQLAQGDFAVLYRARDKELGREVAIKQIHDQYLADPSKLNRYWQEAQLLASLEHPYVMTIYDVVRENGWLVLELMQGNLKDQLGGQPIDLESMRLTLVYTLSALEFLHTNGIIHGDVKPTNLLLDKTNRVKLGDFGIARRLSDGEGSVVKGTTKYMAPEVGAPEFGEVGPHSDVYSLGFSAYELMCGDHFDSLFPGLKMFGRDEQIAWMMWHTSGDQRLPEVSRVLGGVPEDLATVVEKMIDKNPKNRYRNAEKPRLELQARGGEVKQSTEEKEADVEQEKADKKRKLLVYCGFGVSMLFCLALIVSMFFPGEPPPVEDKKKDVSPTVGLVTDINLERQIFWVKLADAEEGSEATPINYDPASDEVTISGNAATFAELRRNDQIEIKEYTSADGGKIKRVMVTRPEIGTVEGVVTNVNTSTAIVTLQLANEEEFDLYLPGTATLTLNGDTEFQGKTFDLRRIQVGDIASAKYEPTNTNSKATTFAALRNVEFKGHLVSINTQLNELTATTSREENASEKTLSLAKRCQITLNGEAVIDGMALTLSKLKAGDAITVTHNEEVVQIDARRQFTAKGTLVGIDTQNRQLEVKLDNYPTPISFTLAEDCELDFLASGEPALMSDFRINDLVTIAHLSPDLKDPVANTVSLKLTPDRRTWAYIIAVQDYSDQRLPRLPYAETDAQAIRDSLVRHYRVAEDQLVFELDPTAFDLKQSLPAKVQAAPAGSQIICYFIGHSYLSDTKVPLLALKAFDGQKMDERGLPLKWLVQLLETSPAAEKLLILDAAHSGSGQFQGKQPSTDVLIEALRPTPLAAPSTSVILLANSSGNEKGNAVVGEPRGIFGSTVAKAYSGEADFNDDLRIAAPELIDYVVNKTPQLRGARNATQTPLAFLPNAKPDRLSAEYKAAVRSVLAAMSGTKIDVATQQIYQQAKAEDPGQPDIDIALALVHLKQNRTASSDRLFEDIIAHHPDRQIPYLALSWQRFNQKNYPEGLNLLRHLVSKLPPSKGTTAKDQFSQQTYRLAGQLRQFALGAAEPAILLSVAEPLDRAVIAQGDYAKLLYGGGVKVVRDEVTRLQERIDVANDASVAKLKLDKKRLSYYSNLDITNLVKYLESQLETE